MFKLCDYVFSVDKSECRLFVVKFTCILIHLFVVLNYFRCEHFTDSRENTFKQQQTVA